MATPSEIRDHHTHCAPHLARLHLLGILRPDEPAPPCLADEVNAVTSAILAEAGAALRATLAAVPGTRRTAVAEFLANRMAKLAAAADETVRAAKDADAAAMHRCLRRFEMLTSAVWTVQLAMPGEARQPRPAGGPRNRLRPPVAARFRPPCSASAFASPRSVPGTWSGGS